MSRRESGSLCWEVFDEARDDYVDLAVEYTIIAGTPEYIPGLDRPDLYDPGSAPEVVIDSVCTEGGEVYPLSPAEEAKLVERIIETHEWDEP